MIEEERQRILDNLSPDNKEKFYKLEIDFLEFKLNHLESKLNNREKHISYLQWYIAIFTLIQIILFIVRG